MVPFHGTKSCCSCAYRRVCQRPCAPGTTWYHRIKYGFHSPLVIVHIHLQMYIPKGIHRFIPSWEFLLSPSFWQFESIIEFDNFKCSANVLVINCNTSHLYITNANNYSFLTLHGTLRNVGLCIEWSNLMVAWANLPASWQQTHRHDHVHFSHHRLSFSIL